MSSDYTPPVNTLEELEALFLKVDLSNLDAINAAANDINLDGNRLTNVSRITNNAGVYIGGPDAFLLVREESANRIEIDFEEFGGIFNMRTTNNNNADALETSVIQINTGTTIGSGNTGGISMFTGDAQGNGDTGNIEIKCGLQNTGARGEIVLDAVRFNFFTPQGGTLQLSEDGTGQQWTGDRPVRWDLPAHAFEITSDFYRYYGASGEFMNLTSPAAGTLTTTYSSGATFMVGNGSEYAFFLNEGLFTIYGAGGDGLQFDNDTAGEIGVESLGATTTIRFDSVVRLARLAADPVSAVGGDVYYNTGTGKFRGYNDVLAAWEDLN